MVNYKDGTEAGNAISLFRNKLQSNKNQQEIDKALHESIPSFMEELGVYEELCGEIKAVTQDVNWFLVQRLTRQNDDQTALIVTIYDQYCAGEIDKEFLFKELENYIISYHNIV